jgi:hypothetical protein
VDGRIILWRIDPLLSGETVNNDGFWERHGKHVPAATNTHATTELLLETGCFLHDPCRDVTTRIVGAMT